MGAPDRDIRGPQSGDPLTRRGLITRAGAAGAAAFGAAALGETELVAEAGAAIKPQPRPKTPDAVLRALMAGNRRYVSGKIRQVDYNRLGDRIAETQKPLAAIITCADSRVSPSVIFDLGLGNVFVSRVAGNSIDAGTLGSTEYAVAVLGVQLVMVLAHSDCGAVKAAIKVASGKESFPAHKFGAIGELVGAIVGPVRSLPPARRTLARATVVNAQAQAKRVAARGPLIKPAVASRRVRVVAAVYDIASGRVSLA